MLLQCHKSACANSKGRLAFPHILNRHACIFTQISPITLIFRQKHTNIKLHQPLPRLWLSDAAEDCPSQAPLVRSSAPVHQPAAPPEELWSPAAPHTAAAAPAGGPTHTQTHRKHGAIRWSHHVSQTFGPSVRCENHIVHLCVFCCRQN